MTKVYMSDTAITAPTATAVDSIVLARDESRICATVVNVGSSDVYLNIDAATVAEQGIIVYPSCAWEISHDNFTNADIHAICKGGESTDLIVMKNIVGLGNYASHLSLGPSDERIGAVEIQDATTTDRAKVRDGNVAGVATDHVIVVQHQAPSGSPLPSGVDAADPINTASMIQDADTTTRAKVRDGNVAGAVDDHVVVVQHQAPTGKSQPSGYDSADPIYTTAAGNTSPVLLSGIDAHYSPAHFTAAWASATTLTLSGVPYTLTTGQFLGVVQMSTAGDSKFITPEDGSYQFGWADPTLTVTGATFLNTDEFIVVVLPTLSLTDNPIHQDLTDQVADTYYYPDSGGFDTFGYRHGTLQYKLIDCEFTVQGKNHDDLDWEDVTTMSVRHGVGAPAIPPMTLGAAGMTINGVLDFRDAALDMYRVEVVTYDATNTIRLNWRQRV